MSQPAADVAIRDGLAAWARGDLDALERVLHPAVTLRAMQPGPWDCDDRDQVMSLLRLREGQRAAGQSREVEVRRVDDVTYVVSDRAAHDGVATRVTIADGTVISLQQISTETADPDAELAVAAIRSGDITALDGALTVRPYLAHLRVPGYRGRTLLHIATDWPGYLPDGPEVVHVLISHGADPNDRGADAKRGETPLHWAASSDDVDVARALLDGGADAEAPEDPSVHRSTMRSATAAGRSRNCLPPTESGSTSSGTRQVWACSTGWRRCSRPALTPSRSRRRSGMRVPRANAAPPSGCFGLART